MERLKLEKGHVKVRKEVKPKYFFGASAWPPSGCFGTPIWPLLSCANDLENE